MSETRHVVCPHCGKEFKGELLSTTSAPGPTGFKCPHCRLFVPVERAAPADDERAEPAA